MQISEILSSNSVLSGQEFSSKKATLEELSKLLANTDPSIGYIEVFDSLIAREKLGNTGFGKGISIPHGRLKNSKKTAAAFIQLQHGIDYDAIDNDPVDLFFALLIPENSTDEHLKILADLSKMFSDPKTLEQLRSETTVKEIHKILTK